MEASQGRRSGMWTSPSECWSPEHGHILGREAELHSVWDLCPGSLHAPEDWSKCINSTEGSFSSRLHYPPKANAGSSFPATLISTWMTHPTRCPSSSPTIFFSTPHWPHSLGHTLDLVKRPTLVTPSCPPFPNCT